MASARERDLSSTTTTCPAVANWLPVVAIALVIVVVAVPACGVTRAVLVCACSGTRRSVLAHIEQVARSDALAFAARWSARSAAASPGRRLRDASSARLPGDSGHGLARSGRWVLARRRLARTLGRRSWVRSADRKFAAAAVGMLAAGSDDHAPIHEAATVGAGHLHRHLSCDQTWCGAAFRRQQPARRAAAARPDGPARPTMATAVVL